MPIPYSPGDPIPVDITPNQMRELVRSDPNLGSAILNWMLDQCRPVLATQGHAALTHLAATHPVEVVRVAMCEVLGDYAPRGPRAPLPR